MDAPLAVPRGEPRRDLPADRHPHAFVGEIDAETEASLRDLLGPKALFASPASRVRRAGFLAELGWRELETRTQTKISEIEPLYVRQPSIRGSFEQPFASPPADERALGLPKRS